MKLILFKKNESLSQITFIVFDDEVADKLSDVIDNSISQDIEFYIEVFNNHIFYTPASVTVNITGVDDEKLDMTDFCNTCDKIIERLNSHFVGEYKFAETNFCEY